MEHKKLKINYNILSSGTYKVYMSFLGKMAIRCRYRHQYFQGFVSSFVYFKVQFEEEICEIDPQLTLIPRDIRSS